MPLYWLRAALTNLDEGEFAEGHKLDRKWKVPKEMVGRRLSQEEAKRLLAEFEQEDRGSNATIRCSRSECCSPSLAWTHSLTHRRCRPIFLLDVQKLQRCVPNAGDLMPRDRGSVYMAAGTNLDLPYALLVPHLRVASA